MNRKKKKKKKKSHVHERAIKTVLRARNPVHEKL